MLTTATKMFLVSGSFVAMLCLLVAGGTARADDGAKVAELQDRLREANLQNSLEDMRLKPWHLKLTFQLYDAKGKPSEQGTLEEWWASAQQYKISYSSPSYTGVVVRKDDLFYQDPGVERAPDSLETIRLQVVHPMPDADEIAESAPLLRKQKFGAVQLECIMLNHPIKNLEETPLGLFPTYCFDPAKNALRLSANYGTMLLIRNSMGQFQGRTVALDSTIKAGDVLSSTAHIETLESLPTPEGCCLVASSMRPRNPPATLPANVTAGRATSQVPPVYPASAKANHIEGTVTLHAVIGRDGRIRSLTPVSAPDPSLTVSAILAVRQWRYKPYLLNGEPVEVDTTIRVNYAFGPG